MCLFRKLMVGLSCAMALAVSIVSPAVATDTVQVVNESTGATCSSIVPPHETGGCAFSLVGTVELRIDFPPFPEIHEAQCNIKLSGRISGSGVLVFDKFTLSTGTGCPTTSVMLAEALPWEGGIEEDGPTGVTSSSVAVQIDPAETDVDCAGTLSFNIVETGIPSAEHYDVVFTNAAVSVCELDMSLEMEKSGSDTPVHINHP